jgi:uncharacterized protein (TIGR03437 family)
MFKAVPVLCSGALLLTTTPLLAQTNTLSIQSAAGGASILSPGSLATAYAVGMDATPTNGQLDQFGNFPTELAGYSLDVNGSAAQLLYVGGAQMNFFVPATATIGDTPVTLTFRGGSARGIAAIRPVAPGIFTMVQNGRQIGAILNAVTFQANPFQPETPLIPICDKRTRLAIFGTGTGLAANRVRPRDVRVEAQDLSGVTYNLDVEAAVPAPGLPGVEQINVVLHNALRPGPIQLRVIANGVASNRVQVDLALRDGAAPSGACLARTEVTRSVDGAFSVTTSLAWAAPAGGVTVALASSDAAVSVPASVVIPAGQYSAILPVSLTTAAVPSGIVINGSLNGNTVSGGFDVGAPCVDGIGFSFPGIVSGNGLTGRVNLTDPAPPEGTPVTLSSTHPSVTVGPRVVVPGGQMSAPFPIATGLATIAAPATVIATGACGGTSGVFNLVLTPCIASVSLSSATVAGGGTLTGTVTLNAPALAGGQAVDLRSSDPAVQVDAQVRVPEGQISATFTVKTSAVTSAKQASILASVGNCGSASASLSVTP